MHKRERLEKTLAGEVTDRPPLILWRYFPGDDQRSADLGRAAAMFQHQWDFDALKLSPAPTYSIVDYGAQDQLRPDLSGGRVLSKPFIANSLAWTELRRLDPTRGALGQGLESLRMLFQAYGESVPLLHTLCSPLSQALLLAGRETLLYHLRHRADRLKTGLSLLTENIFRYLEALKKVPLAGIFYEIHTAQPALLTEAEYAEFARPYDLKILQALPTSWWLNVVQLEGTVPMLKWVADYPIQVLGWQDRPDALSLAEGRPQFRGTLLGGLGRDYALHEGVPSDVRQQARQAYEACDRRRLILSASAPLWLSTPWANIRAARQVFEDKTL
jgi:uroporphyrinogen decarboxylase